MKRTLTKSLKEIHPNADGNKYRRLFYELFATFTNIFKHNAVSLGRVTAFYGNTKSKIHYNTLTDTLRIIIFLKDKILLDKSLLKYMFMLDSSPTSYAILNYGNDYINSMINSSNNLWFKAFMRSFIEAAAYLTKINLLDKHTVLSKHIVHYKIFNTLMYQNLQCMVIHNNQCGLSRIGGVDTNIFGFEIQIRNITHDASIKYGALKYGLYYDLDNLYDNNDVVLKPYIVYEYYINGMNKPLIDKNIETNISYGYTNSLFGGANTNYGFDPLTNIMKLNIDMNQDISDTLSLTKGLIKDDVVFNNKNDVIDRIVVYTDTNSNKDDYKYWCQPVLYDTTELMTPYDCKSIMCVKNNDVYKIIRNIVDGCYLNNKKKLQNHINLMEDTLLKNGTSFSDTTDIQYIPIDYKVYNIEYQHTISYKAKESCLYTYKHIPFVTLESNNPLKPNYVIFAKGMRSFIRSYSIKNRGVADRDLLLYTILDILQYKQSIKLWDKSNHSLKTVNGIGNLETFLYPLTMTPPNIYELVFLNYLISYIILNKKKYITLINTIKNRINILTKNLDAESSIANMIQKLRNHYNNLVSNLLISSLSDIHKFDAASSYYIKCIHSIYGCLAITALYSLKRIMNNLDETYVLKKDDIYEMVNNAFALAINTIFIDKNDKNVIYHKDLTTKYDDGCLLIGDINKKVKNYDKQSIHFEKILVRSECYHDHSYYKAYDTLYYRIYKYILDIITNDFTNKPASIIAKSLTSSKDYITYVMLGVTDEINKDIRRRNIDSFKQYLKHELQQLLSVDFVRFATNAINKTYDVRYEICTNVDDKNHIISFEHPLNENDPVIFTKYSRLKPMKPGTVSMLFHNKHVKNIISMRVEDGIGVKDIGYILHNYYMLKSIKDSSCYNGYVYRVSRLNVVPEIVGVTHIMSEGIEIDI